MATKTIKVPAMVNGAPTGPVQEITVEDYGVSGWGPKDKHRLLNTKMTRVDAPFKSTGTAKYTYDMNVAGMLHGRMVTSKHAHAKITSVDISAAEKMPGVKLVLAAVEDGAEVFYEGQPIAAVAATTPELAEDAARAVVVKYEVLPHVVTGDDALKPGAVLAVRGGAGGGRRGGGGFPGGGRGGRGGAGQGTEEQADAALKEADAVIEAEYRTPILHHACLETHIAVADYSGGESATAYVSTQGTMSIGMEAQRELGVPVVGIVQNMGGGFGSKGNGGGIPATWAYRLAKQLKTPVKMAFTRREEFLAAGNGPGSIQRFKAGASKAGKLVGMSVMQYTLPGLGGGGVAAQPYQYSCPVVFRQQQSLTTHEDSSVPLRAPGHPQACFAMESLMDELAYKIGMDPVEFRKKNVPANTSGEAWIRQLTKGAEVIGWENRNKTPGKLAGPLVRGMGCAIGAWSGAGRQSCVVTVQIGQDGSVLVFNGSQDLGTGTRTYLRAVVAEELGLEMKDVQEKIGDTRLGASIGSGGSATAASLSPAAKDAAYKARMELCKAAAPHLGNADPDAILLDKGYVMGNGQALAWKDACRALSASGISVTGTFQQALAGSGAHGASFAEVEVDIETGFVKVVKMCHVQDGGLILNRLAAESQINGGMIQSIGMALYEGRIMDGELGVMVNPAFNDYKIVGCMEVPPEIIPVIDDGDTRNVVMGIAEPANIPGCGAVANAVYNACGVRVRSTPITPDKILDGLMQMRRNV